MIEHNYAIGEHDNLRIPLHSDTDETPCPIDLIMAGNMVAGDTYLANEIRTILNKYPTKTIAIITRRNREIEHLLRLCERCDIPASAERGIDIFSHPLGTLFLLSLNFWLILAQLKRWLKLSPVDCGILISKPKFD